MERVECLTIYEVGVSSVLEEEMDDLNAAVACGPHEWGSVKLAPEGIHDGATRDEERGEGHVSVDGRPVERRDLLVVGIGGMCQLRVQELSDGLRVAPLRGQMEWARWWLGGGGQSVEIEWWWWWCWWW
jgi:hypothetical protein